MKNKIQSNVQLQILLHFNIFLFILWIILHIFYYQRIEIIQYCQQVFKVNEFNSKKKIRKIQLTLFLLNFILE